MTDEEIEANIASAMAIVNAAAMYQTLAIVGALAERRLVDPMKVAKWAEFCAKGQGQNLAPDIRAGVQDQLAGFSALLASMAEMPKNAGRG